MTADDYSQLPSISGGLLLHPWIISLIVCFGLLPNEGNFLRILFFRGLFNNISSNVGTVLYAARVRAFGFALLTYTHTILAVKAF